MVETIFMVASNEALLSWSLQFFDAFPPFMLFGVQPLEFLHVGYFWICSSMYCSR